MSQPRLKLHISPGGVALLLNEQLWPRRAFRPNLDQLRQLAASLPAYGEYLGRALFEPLRDDLTGQWGRLQNDYPLRLVVDDPEGWLTANDEMLAAREDGNLGGFLMPRMEQPGLFKGLALVMAGATPTELAQREPNLILFEILLVQAGQGNWRLEGLFYVLDPDYSFSSSGGGAHYYQAQCAASASALVQVTSLLAGVDSLSLSFWLVSSGSPSSPSAANAGNNWTNWLWRTPWDHNPKTYDVTVSVTAAISNTIYGDAAWVQGFGGGCR